jgi:hypothetical protein
MDRTERTDQATEHSAKNKGQKKHAKGPPKSMDKAVPRQQAGDPNQGVKLEKKPYRLIYSEIDILGKNERVFKVSIVREPAFHQQEQE